MATPAAWSPALYDHRAAFVSELASDLVLWLRPSPGERILDLGCGTGTLTAEIARSGARVVGVDSSSDMIAAARAKYAALPFEVADGQALSYAAEFDALFSNAALHWMRRADLEDRWPVLCEKVSARCRSTLFRDGHWVLDYVRLRLLATKP